MRSIFPIYSVRSSMAQPISEKQKVKSAKETINAMNPDVTVKTYRQFVTSENIMDLIADYDFIIDGTDNLPGKVFNQ